MEGDVVTMQEIFTFERRGIDAEGNVLGEHRSPTGVRPRFAETAALAGIQLPAALFEPRRIAEGADVQPMVYVLGCPRRGCWRSKAWPRARSWPALGSGPGAHAAAHARPAPRRRSEEAQSRCGPARRAACRRGC